MSAVSVGALGEETRRLGRWASCLTILEIIFIDAFVGGLLLSTRLLCVGVG